MEHGRRPTRGITRAGFLARTSAAVAGALAAPALGGLADSTEAASQVTLRFGMYSSPTWQPSYEQALRNFMKAYPNIKVKAEWAPYDAWTQKIATELASGTTPDVSILDWDDFYDRTS